ncbi:MAG: DUF2807 domain-containing protein [Bacteroidetes bacterium]|nr:MAG: DUF2807 domain-containing protein [Bacteroidota bacterium]
MKTKTYNLPILIALLATVFMLQSCVYDVNAIKGNKNIVTVENDLAPFESLQISGIFKVYLTEGSSPHIKIETDENIHEYITVEVRNNTLHLGMKKGSYDPSRLDVYITASQLEKIGISGAASLTSQNTLLGETLSINSSGASNINVSVQSESLSTSVSGAGKISIRGEVYQHDIQISGVASIDCLQLATEETKVSISGAGSAKVHAASFLDARVSGVGSIRYSGNPENIRTSTSGAGSIKPV